MNVIGYANPNNYFPSPLITFAEENDRYFAIYPSCKVVEIENFKEIENRIPHYVNENNKYTINHGNYAYGIDKDRVLIGKPIAVRKELFKTLESNKCDEISMLMLREFLENTSDDGTVIIDGCKSTWISYLESIKSNPKVKVLITKRKVLFRGVKLEAQRIIIQLRKKSGLKSHLRKNFHHDDDVANIIMKRNDILPEKYRVKKSNNTNPHGHQKATLRYAF